MQGIKVPKPEASETWDSNTITPGTPFMHRLSLALKYYVHLRLNNDPGWRDITVWPLFLYPLDKKPEKPFACGIRAGRPGGQHFTCGAEVRVMRSIRSFFDHSRGPEVL